MTGDVHLQVKVDDASCVEVRAEDCGLVIFGASGDLAHRKLFPALFALFVRGLLPDNFFMLGFARSEMSDETFRAGIVTAIQSAAPQSSPEQINAFSQQCRYVSGAYDDPDAYLRLAESVHRCDVDFCTRPNRVFHLATPPQLVSTIVERLGAAGLTGEPEDGSTWARVVIEKPFGRDLQSALEMDSGLRQTLRQRQIYRMDHYLGKETVQTILMLRFANAVFEPIWNRRYVDFVQITVAESIGVEHRAGYYDQIGCWRDMFQNHMLQMLSLVAMEPPISFEADAVRDEKIKLMRSIRPFPTENLNRWTVRGQYGPGRIDGREVVGYGDEQGISPDSTTETFVAAKFFVDNWRWQGVPFFLRSGKRLARKLSQIVITFKKPPLAMFRSASGGDLPANVLVLRVQPDEGMSLRLEAKQPGTRVCLGTLEMSFKYREVFGIDPPDAYERLLHDVMLGDQTLFWRRDGVEAAWSLITPVLESWETNPEAGPLHLYPAGSMGPAGSEELLSGEGYGWLQLLGQRAS
ncbi:MAG: glucose-6-phosphate dehydrogenase [Proteobacteria bacterium]|nr:glucose-6-phosphate dehydrogenase [Pseudomonadota bacterium]